MPLQWYNQCWQSQEKGAGKRYSERAFIPQGVHCLVLESKITLACLMLDFKRGYFPWTVTLRPSLFCSALSSKVTESARANLSDRGMLIVTFVFTNFHLVGVFVLTTRVESSAVSHRYCVLNSLSFIVIVLQSLHYSH